ncbi:CinA family protein [Ensifer adhaerens]|uniref:CinA family protein n=1 Tax=Ensifer adhaerens TaxID=106592 RepID=A0ABY8HMD1_ENSAD|nr:MULTISPECIES: CinA family protein [Ensifer]KSV74641.1 competence damage-inducible protein A [Sinorhizobium sp. GL2]ANK72233.1 damage-inducible protein CinA [Ensifer adhaerens]KDP74331.1 damage-inducible protein CinA [Ensifer adhaerens]KQX21110.1 damage-inducible protein CinA [Ensifer sp. Root423]KQX58333.1 damage-inducible protein CinA [Ensifer sp. Root1298]
MWSADIEVKAGEIIAQFTANGRKVATAESCTGGLIAGALTEISGSSAVLDRGFVTYSNEAKVAMLGVETATLVAHGAVSRQTAIEMAQGAIAHSAADFAVAVTGIAGPSGGSAEKPVGLVHLAAAGRNGALLHREMRYGDIGRSNIRLATIRTALDLLTQIAQAE